MKAYTARYAVTEYYDVVLSADNIEDAWDEATSINPDDIECGSYSSSDWEVIEVEPLDWEEE